MRIRPLALSPTLPLSILSSWLPNKESPPAWRLDLALEDVYPGGRAFQFPVNAGLNLLQEMESTSLLRTAVDLIPDAGSLGEHLALPAGASAAARAVSKLLRAVHRAGEHGVAEDALAALIAAENRFLEYLLGPEDRIVEYRIA